MIVISDDPSSLATEDGISGESGTLNEETKEISVHVVTIIAAGEEYIVTLNTSKAPRVCTLANDILNSSGDDNVESGKKDRHGSVQRTVVRCQ